MNSSTSWPSWSRKYSAIVSPDSATRMRAPGGSFICPKTSIVLSSTPDSFISSHRSLPSRERSPTPQNADRPPCSWARLWISSWMITVLPTPAPPNRPTLPPLAYGASRSITLIPVSNISVVGVSCLDRRRLAVDRPALGVLGQRLAEVDRLAEQVEDPPERHAADRDRDRRAGVDHLGAAGEAVGRVHRDRADAVVAEVLLDLADEVLVLAAAMSSSSSARGGLGTLDRDRVVDLGQLVGEHGLDHDALDLLDPADVALALGAARCVRFPVVTDMRGVSLAEAFGAGDDFHDLLGDLGLAGAVHLQGVVLDQRAARSRTRCASRSSARRARRRSTPAARGRSRSRRSRAPAAGGSPRGRARTRPSACVPTGRRRSLIVIRFVVVVSSVACCNGSSVSRRMTCESGEM